MELDISVLKLPVEDASIGSVEDSDPTEVDWKVSELSGIEDESTIEVEIALLAVMKDDEISWLNDVLTDGSTMELE